MCALLVFSTLYLKYFALQLAKWPWTAPELQC